MRAHLATMILAGVIQAHGAGFSPARYVSGTTPTIPPLVVSGGQVFLDVSVTAGGNVDAVHVLRTTPPFTDALVSAVNAWRFAPATMDSAATSSYVFVAGVFAAPTLAGPTLGEPPKDVASAGTDVPRPVTTAPLAYPARAIGTGAVLVELAVDEDGRTSDARVIVPSPAFDDAALTAARAWSFRPAQRRGRPVLARAYLVCVFQQPVVSPAGAGLP